MDHSALKLNIVVTSMLGRWPPAIPYQVDSIPFVYSEIYVPSISKLLAHAARNIWVLHFEVRFQPQRNPIITILLIKSKEALLAFIIHCHSVWAGPKVSKFYL